MTGTSLLQPHPLGLYTSSGLCVLLLLLVVKGEYWKMRATGWKVPRDSLRRKALPLRCRAVQKGHDFHPAGFLRTPGNSLASTRCQGAAQGFLPKCKPKDLRATQRVGLGLLCVSRWSLSTRYQTQGLPGKLQKDWIDIVSQTLNG